MKNDPPATAIEPSVSPSSRLAAIAELRAGRDDGGETLSLRK